MAKAEKVKLTKRVVDAAKATGKEYVIWDNEVAHFGLRVTQAGGKTYILSYRHLGKQDRCYFGRPTEITVEQARHMAMEANTVLKAGRNPKKERQQARADASALAFDAYVERFISDFLPDNWERFQQEGARLLRREAVPHFSNTPLPHITRRDVTALFDALRPRPGIAKNTSTVLRKLFRWAVSRGDIPDNPMAGMELPKGPKGRKRYLPLAELVHVWRATQSIQHPFGSLVRVLILTGQRRDEVAAMHWNEIDLEAMVWTIPGSRTKNKKDHLVPLDRAVLGELDGANGTREGFVFGVNQPFSNWNYWKTKLKRLLEPMEHWTLHDLRRSNATGMQSLGVPTDHIEAVQSRAVVQGAGTRYQRYAFLDEKRAALEKWTRHMTAAADDLPVAA